MSVRHALYTSPAARERSRRVSCAGEGASAMLRTPSPDALTRVDLSREAGEV
jgi:hypothetical protein